MVLFNSVIVELSTRAQALHSFAYPPLVKTLKKDTKEGDMQLLYRENKVNGFTDEND